MQQVPNGDPTPEQIRAECRKIRDGWSEREYWLRSGHNASTLLKDGNGFVPD